MPAPNIIRSPLSPRIRTRSPDPVVAPSVQKSQAELPGWNATDGILRRLKEVDSVASRIAHVNSFARSAMACAYKMIHDKPPTDDAFSPLLAKIVEVYALMTERQESARVPSIVVVYGQMARQTLECADFIVHYSETMNFWKRVGKYVSEETFTTIQNYNEVLNNLMQQLQYRTTREIIIYRMADDLDPNDMVYATGAGLDISKCCLPGTREGILSKIKS
ncbi:uncharacterized protein BJ212DRAFT_1380140 [Suillus subaureus]|uniref:Uncharacterized protein n=1 Tax=Suillus subaureus TaxID=48587 RepID=A0A9P7E1X0_9AGAM|nr:uncharacterized protein BJ212DRAFT_1380140 [Suillus subaureus]KAG1809080.1 hypothetical protein BJ212DRAFT_1380140 [Suillus subaureus]